MFDILSCALMSGSLFVITKLAEHLHKQVLCLKEAQCALRSTTMDGSMFERHMRMDIFFDDRRVALQGVCNFVNNPDVNMFVNNFSARSDPGWELVCLRALSSAMTASRAVLGDACDDINDAIDQAHELAEQACALVAM